MDALKQNLLGKISNKKERDAVKKALDMITTKYDMQIMNAKSSQSNDSELQTKYNRISEFNKELLARYKKEQENFYSHRQDIIRNYKLTQLGYLDFNVTKDLQILNELGEWDGFQLI